jgi:hypothetical protein
LEGNGGGSTATRSAHRLDLELGFCADLNLRFGLRDSFSSGGLSRDLWLIRSFGLISSFGLHSSLSHCFELCFGLWVRRLSDGLRGHGLRYRFFGDHDGGRCTRRPAGSAATTRTPGSRGGCRVGVVGFGCLV